MAELEELKNALKRLSESRAVTRPYYQYYRGDHALNFASTKFRNKFGRRLQTLNDNLCKSVVNAPVNRLEVINFADETNPETQDVFWDIWKKCFMPAKSKQVHREAFRTGRAFVIVWADAAGRPVISPQETADIAVWYEGEDRTITKAAKLWYDDSGERYHLTLYYPDRIEKFTTAHKAKTFPNGNAFIPREVAGEPWPLLNPFGRVPVFEFAAPEKLSILDDVIPLQDALNKHFCDLMVAGEFNSLRQRWASGIQFEIDDETNKPIVPWDENDRLWSTNDPEGKFGEFTDSQLKPYLEAKADAREEIARVTGIPAHYFKLNSGEFPSGEALRTAEARFISLVQDAQLDFGEAWGRVLAFALQIERGIVQGYDSTIEVQWRDAAPVGQRELLENALLKLQLGVSKERVLTELGYTESDIAEIMRQTADEAANVQKAVERAFAAGIGVDDSLSTIG